ncbi:DUF6283 family protein [Rhizobium sp. BK176]|uniref:DUF6283 family protein n=1 Tax=Rhizobium sp. BK176 TaxID=2587071 RepID=UPI0021677967|nr:DUF6283 family protein [Rhizobium sp. BK176]MCS4088956.1 hypothetical protein [Rhizobium sp. BK176]
MAKKVVTIHETRVCSNDYGVTTVETRGAGAHAHRRKPCKECPWRMDVPTGVFPADAFRESANTAYDGAINTFGCHMNKASAVATCAGFLLRHSDNNIGIRLSLTGDRIDLDSVEDGGFPVYASYRDMAIANGVPADDPVLQQVRSNTDVWDHVARKWVPADEGK